MKESRLRRFPWPAALLCAACVGAAVWTWMRYSWCSEILPFPTYVTRPNNLEKRYVRTCGRCGFVAAERGDHGEPFVFVDVPYATAVRANRRYEGTHCNENMTVVIPHGASYEEGETATFTGRVLVEENSTDYPDIVAARLDTTVSRFHPASITGLFVGAIGAFVFVVALHRWLRKRKARAARTASSRPPESPA